jgi:hypothetical protein
MYSFFLLDPNNALIFYVKTFCRIIIILFLFVYTVSIYLHM